MDSMFLVPLGIGDVIEAFSESSVPGVAYTMAQPTDGDELTIHDGDTLVAEVYMTVLGGCVMRVAPIMGDAHEIASFVSDPAEAEAIIATEEAACRAEELVQQLGGVPAYRKGGKWIPVLPNDRPAWSANVVAANTAKMRLMGVERRSANATAKINATARKAA